MTLIARGSEATTDVPVFGGMLINYYLFLPFSSLSFYHSSLYRPSSQHVFILCGHSSCTFVFMHLFSSTKSGTRPRFRASWHGHKRLINGQHFYKFNLGPNSYLITLVNSIPERIAFLINWTASHGRKSGPASFWNSFVLDESSRLIAMSQTGFGSERRRRYCWSGVATWNGREILFLSLI